MEPYAELLRLTLATPTDDDARSLALAVHGAPLLTRSPLDLVAPWVLGKRAVPPVLLEKLENADDARALAANDVPPCRWSLEPRGWLETVRWAARAADRALPDVRVTDAPPELVEWLWRGLGLALVEAENALGAVVPAARVLRWIAVLGISDDDRALFDEACARAGGLGTMLAEARFHLLVARKIAT